MHFVWKAYSLLTFPRNQTSWEDESGVEGVAVKQRPEGQKLLVVGKRFSAESIRQQLHDGRDDQASAFARQQAKMLEVNGVDQVGSSKTVLGFVHVDR